MEEFKILIGMGLILIAKSLPYIIGTLLAIGLYDLIIGF
jgi:hypothetical protein